MWVDNVSDMDLLNYKPYLRILIDLVEDKKLSNCSIGMYGNWGGGKSTIINFLEKEIKLKDNIDYININAWILEDCENIKLVLLKMVLEELEKKVTKYEVSKVKLNKLKDSINYFNLAADILPEFMSLVLGLCTGNLLSSTSFLQKIKNKILKKDYVIDTNKIKSEYIKNDHINEINDFKTSFEDLLRESKIEKLVIILDDLDRCNSDRILEILEIIKLFLSVNKIIFIVAVDERIIRDAINRKYPDNHLSVYNDYLNKLIQIPLQLREPTENEMSLYLYKLVLQQHLEEKDFKKVISDSMFSSFDSFHNNISEEYIKNILGKDFQFSKKLKEEISVIDAIRDITASSLGGSPRNAKIFLNTFYIRKSLLELYSVKNINLLVLAKIMLLEILKKECYHDLNDWVKHDYDKTLKIYQELLAHVNSLQLNDEENIDIYEETVEWPTKLINWRNAKVIKWIYIEPVEIWKYNLQNYLFLTNTYSNNLVEKRDIIIACKDCGEEFIFTVKEQEFFEEKGLKNKPIRCKNCRNSKRIARDNRNNIRDNKIDF